MNEAWYAVEIYPNAPDQVPCDVCHAVSRVIAVQKVHTPNVMYRCSAECPKCGTREIVVSGIRPENGVG